MNNIIAWLIIFIALLVIEIITVSLISIWFCVGCVAAMAAAYLGCGAEVQLGAFALVSAVSLIAARPLKKHVKAAAQPTNVNALVGKTTYVTEDIDNKSDKGEIKINDVIWQARSLNGEPIAKGTKVTIKEIKGVKILVAEAAS
ncbi:MAG: NfeD family protein [Clostridiales bacterium]|nr:NfeD family protein [Clostridiales bacterium]MCD8214178.1 NfeD family protein [Clostridiales bacterium]